MLALRACMILMNYVGYIIRKHAEEERCFMCPCCSQYPIEVFIKQTKRGDP